MTSLNHLVQLVLFAWPIRANVVLFDKSQMSTSDLFEFVTDYNLETLGDPMWVKQVPDEKSVVCPPTPENLYPEDDRYARGYSKVWVVENTATTPVVVLYVEKETGQELSIANLDVSPPQSDPDAVLYPGEKRMFDVWEGHVFHVRELLPSGAMGEVVFQHRAGIVPITTTTGVVDFQCTNTSDPLGMVGVERDSHLGLSVPSQIPKSDQVVGFRNRVVDAQGKPCPLNVYFLENADINPHGKEQEFFVEYLGADLVRQNHMEDWFSATKFQQTFFGHSYVFRLADDDEVVVDVVTLDKTVISDCSTSKRQNQAKVDTIDIRVDVLHNERIDKDLLGTDKFLASLNKTDSRLDYYIHLPQISRMS